MGSHPVALYSAILADVTDYASFGPVGLGCSPPGASYKQVASSCLLSSLLKKWVPEQSKDLDDKCYEKFLTSNKTCENWRISFEWESDRLLYGEFLREIDNFLHPRGTELITGWYDILSKARCGPGSSIGAGHQSFYAKMFSSKMAVTDATLYTLYRSYIQWSPTSLDAECHRYREFGLPLVTDSSKCSFVPKTSEISRMICIEPSLNMFYQLGLGAILEDRLESWYNINLSVQPSRNRRLACQGSKDGSFSTIDLSSASDSISLGMCKAIFPKWFYDYLERLRSPYMLKGIEKVRLNMVSTMGNGFTFPLQTFIFSALIRAAYRVNGIHIRNGEHCNWACFGDDLICDTRVYRSVKRLLDLLGFSVNSAKTFFEGPFRESCGTDWFYGQPVRGVYIKSLDTPQDYHVAVNLLNEWTAYTGIPLRNGIDYLMQGLKKKFFVPYDEMIDSGVRVPFEFIRGGSIRRDPNLSILYRHFVSRPVRISFDDGAIRAPSRLRNKLIYNPSGLMESLLFGELVAGKISTRQSTSNYRLKLRCTPNWDYMRTEILTNGLSISWQQWETAVLINMSNP
jgi:hypothetical protein